MFFALLLGCISFFVFLTLHVIIFHNRPPERRFRTLIYISAGSLLLYGILFYFGVKIGVNDAVNAFAPAWIINILNGLFIYLFIYFFYFHLIIVFDRSVSPRMMVELDKSPDKRLTVDGIKSAYSLEEKLRRELDDMDYMLRMAKDGDAYTNTKKGITHARLMDFLREYLHIGGHQ